MRLGTFQSPDGEVVVGELVAERVRVLEAPTMIAWLAGSGRASTGLELEAASLTPLAPVPEPPSIRDFYAFERHVAAGARLRGGEIAPYWYEAPAFYFANPAAIHGPGEPVARPDATDRLDFELEIAAVVGVPLGGAASAGRGGLGVAGFTLMNDWSARDVQAAEAGVGLGPHKAKDFAISLGPQLVTPDELPYRDGRLALRARVLVNGEEVTACDASEQHFEWPEIVAHAGRDTRLRPGDVLGSGTLAGGCLLELGPLATGSAGERWIEPGDSVAIEADGLGRLVTPIV